MAQRNRPAKSSSTSSTTASVETPEQQEALVPQFQIPDVIK